MSNRVLVAAGAAGARHKIKARRCREGALPMLRIDSTYARREGRWVVLKYILWAHEMGKAFYEAQEQGYIPDDEPFYHGSILEPSDDGHGYSFTGLDMPAIRYLHTFRPKFLAIWQGDW